MIRVVVICFALLWPGLLRAQDYEIRSGEHDGFSRLVIYMGTPQDWELIAKPGGYKLRLSGSDRGFATGKVFDFIPKRRLTALSSAPGELTLSTACDCPAQAFLVRPDILVIDIHSKVPGPLGDVADLRQVMPYAPVAEESPSKTQGRPGQGLIAAEPGDQPIPQGPLPSQARRPIDPMALTRFQDWPGQGGQTQRAVQLLGFAGVQPSAGSRIDARELVEGIAAAASQGLVSLAGPDTLSVGDALRAAPERGFAHQQLSVRDGFLRDPDRAALAEERRNCRPADLFTVDEWGDAEQPPSELLQGFRAKGPWQSLGTDAVEGAVQLARAYIYLGFGSEAADVLRTYRIPEAQEEVLMPLAKIVENPGQLEPNPFADQLACDTGAALWGFVASPLALPTDELLATKTILRSFAALPPWLKTQLGGVAMANFEAIDDLVSAEAIRDAVYRARVAQYQTSLPQAVPGEEAVIPPVPELQGEEGSDRAARMADLAQSLKAQEASPSPEEREEIAALIFETRGSSESIALLEAYIHAAGDAQAILDGEQILGQLSRSRFVASYPILAHRDALLRAAAQQPSHDVFLGLLSRSEKQFRKEPPDLETLEVILRRLQDMGLPRSAAALAEHAPPDTRLAVQTLPAPSEDGPGQSNSAQTDGQAGQVNLPAVPVAGAVFGANTLASEQASALRALLRADAENAGGEDPEQRPMEPLKVLQNTDDALELLRGLSLSAP
ncbi:MAG: hypothetical protein OIF40_17115 [Mangrovicoccus sp.]|nr:hypothetical protein [Mangrovicoccus sp.]